MDLILHQLAGLFLRAVPTAVLFLLLLAAYRLLVHTPLMKVLAERRERTTGAMARAEAAIRAADARAQEYEAKLRAARAEIFHAREQRVLAMQRERDRVLEEALRAGGLDGVERVGRVDGPVRSLHRLGRIVELVARPGVGPVALGLGRTEGGQLRAARAAARRRRSAGW